jgi:tRNA A-37 threonylcarbamoyl transferase component Bud32
MNDQNHEQNMDTSLKKKRFYGPDVHLIHRDGSALVEKTYRRRTLPVRLVGKLLVCWESYIYSKLRDIRGIPELAASPDSYTITTVFMGGKDMRRKTSEPDDAYFCHLEELIQHIHERGVIHLDMRNRRNYGMDDNGMPYLVDFASSIYIPFGGILKRWLCAIDWMGYLKVKAKISVSSLSEEEQRSLSLGNNLSLLWLPPRIKRLLKDLFRRFRK